MGQNFIPDTVNQTLLFPPSLEPCRWSKDNTKGRWYKSLNNKHCVEVESGKRKPLLVP